MKETLENVYVSERPRLLGWMRTRIGFEDAEDALHDVLVRTLVHLDSLEAVRDITAWLWSSAAHAVIDVWRKKSRRKCLGEIEAGTFDDFDTFLDSIQRGVEEDVEREELLSRLSVAISSLPLEQREVIVAQGLKGESFKEISQRTGVPAVTLASRKRSAIAKLRNELSEYMEDEV